jgi:putative effector of murein hydrolase
MTALSGILLASFTTPMRINTDPASMLWLLPLLVSVVVVYKATKVFRIRLYHFARESAVLFGSILAFIVVAALILYAVAWLVTDQLPGLLHKASF